MLPRAAGSGSPAWTRARGLPRRDASRRPANTLQAVHDATGRECLEHELYQLNGALERRLEERTADLIATKAQLHQAQKMDMVGQFTSGIAHDFNNLLQAVDASLKILQRRLEQGRVAEAGEFVLAAQETVERAAALTHRLLAFTRCQELQPRPLKVDRLVEGAAALIGYTAGPAVTVRVHNGDDCWTVLCDASQLENVLLNLGINARDAMPQGGQLTIATRNVHLSATDVAGQDGVQPGEYVEIAVTDSGTGMSAEVLARALEPFFTTKPPGRGTGLGLSQLHGFVRQFNGAVRLESALGRGTTVRLHLPRHAVADRNGPEQV